MVPQPSSYLQLYSAVTIVYYFLLVGGFLQHLRLLRRSNIGNPLLLRLYGVLLLSSFILLSIQAFSIWDQVEPLQEFL
jgi:hypothetical protein